MEQVSRPADTIKILKFSSSLSFSPFVSRNSFTYVTVLYVLIKGQNQVKLKKQKKTRLQS